MSKESSFAAAEALKQFDPERISFLENASVGELVADHARFEHPYVKEYYDSLRIVYLDLDPTIILCAKTPLKAYQSLQSAGVSGIRPYDTLQRIKRKGFNRTSPDPRGNFTFEPGRFYLMRTKSFIDVPDNTRYELKPFFYRVVDNKEHPIQELPLTTNISAPILQPGDLARITYEVINTSDQPIQMNVNDLMAEAYVVPLSTIPEVKGSERVGRFKTQLRDIRI